MVSTFAFTYSNLPMFAAFVLLGLTALEMAGAQSIGVCYGMKGDKLPTSQQVIDLYRSRKIGRMRLYGPNQAALQALRGSGIQVILDAPTPDLQQLATDTSIANDWVQTNIKSYSPDVSFRYIAVGNEAIPGNNAQYVLPAMLNIYNAIKSAGLQDKIKVSTSVATSVLGIPYPPSQGTFTPEASSSLGPIISYLASMNVPLLVNVYPYFSYIYNPKDISLPYALFTANSVVVTDGQYQYMNLFDATMDAMYSAMENTGGSNVPIVVSESGWPSNGGNAATVENAQTYNSNLIRHVAQGTPKRPGALEAYIFAMFNENNKTGPEIERNFGLFYPNQQPVYEINFT